MSLRKIIFVLFLTTATSQSAIAFETMRSCHATLEVLTTRGNTIIYQATLCAQVGDMIDCKKRMITDGNTAIDSVEHWDPETQNLTCDFYRTRYSPGYRQDGGGWTRPGFYTSFFDSVSVCGE